MNSSDLLKSIKQRIASLVNLDDVERKYALKSTIADVRKVYEQVCLEYKAHYKGMNETRELKKACRDTLSELRRMRKQIP